MSLLQQINDDLKTAMKAKDEARLRGVRAIRSAILLAQTEKGGHKDLSDEDIMKLLQKLVKQRKDSLAIYEQQGRGDLAQQEQEEIDVLSSYLPKAMSEDELRAAVQAIITGAGATSMKDMGRVMGMANQQLAGKADGSAIAALVKQLLNG